MKRIALVAVSLLVGVGVLGLAACGSGDDAGTSGGTNSTVASGEFNDADVLFLQSMIPHHEQAVEMAELALDPRSGAGADVTALAKRIQAAQDPEIAQMEAWLTEWEQPHDMDTSDGHDMSEMEGMMSADEMASLEAATGAEFDSMWLAMMVEHHQGAIAMATTVTSDGTNSDVAKLAGDIIAAQQTEIDEMNGLLGR